MADEKQVMENQDEITEHEVKKPLLDAFRDLFKRPAALPGEIPSKHKTTNIDMRTSMSFREFRANIMKSVGDFFQSISKIGGSKKEETLNKYAKEYVNDTAEKSAEKTRDDDATVVSQQQIRIPGQVSIKNVRTAPVVEHIRIDEAATNDINKIKNEEGLFESDSSTDGAPADVDIVLEPEKKSAVPNVVVMAEMTVNGEPGNEKDSKTKTIATKGKGEAEADPREL